MNTSRPRSAAYAIFAATFLAAPPAHAFTDGPILAAIFNQMVQQVALARQALENSLATLRETRTIATMAGKALEPVLDLDKLLPDPRMFQVPVAELRDKGGLANLAADIGDHANALVGREGTRLNQDLRATASALGKVPIDKLWSRERLAGVGHKIRDAHQASLQRLEQQLIYAGENATEAIRDLGSASVDTIKKAGYELRSHLSTAAASIQGAMSLAAIDAREAKSEVARAERQAEQHEERQADASSVALPAAEDRAAGEPGRAGSNGGWQ